MHEISPSHLWKNSKVELKSALQCSFFRSPQYFHSPPLSQPFPRLSLSVSFERHLEEIKGVLQRARLSLWRVETQTMRWPSCFLPLHHGHVACCLLSKGQNNCFLFCPLHCLYYRLAPRRGPRSTYLSKLQSLTFNSFCTKLAHKSTLNCGSLVFLMHEEEVLLSFWQGRWTIHFFFGVCDVFSTKAIL